MDAQIKSPLRAAIYLAPKGFKWKIVGKKSRERVRRAAWELCQTLDSRRTKWHEDPEFREYVVWKTHGLRFTHDTVVDDKMLSAAEKYIPKKYLPLKGKYPRSKNLPAPYLSFTPVGVLSTVAKGPEGPIQGPGNSEDAPSSVLERVFQTGRKPGRPRKYPKPEDIKPESLDIPPIEPHTLPQDPGFVSEDIEKLFS
jgi:hypothetical protein